MITVYVLSGVAVRFCSASQGASASWSSSNGASSLDSDECNPP